MSSHLPKPPCVLIVDDDRDVVNGISLRLRSKGYDIQAAFDGEAGLAAALKEIPDLIVLDVRMPKMDGLTFLAKRREHAQIQKIPIIVLSASAFDKVKTLDAGAYCFLSKPFDSQELLDSVASALDMHMNNGMARMNRPGQSSAPTPV